MSSLTATEVRGMMEAYAQVYAPLEEEREVEELGLQMIENAAYVLFSQGYGVEDVISYFEEATEDTIVEDFVNFAEGNLIIESVAVSDEYIAEQFEILNEGLLDFAARQGGRLMQAGRNIKNALTPAAKAPVKNYKSPLTTALSQGSRPTNVPTPSAAKPGLLQRAATGAKDLIKKIPGAQKAVNIGRTVAKTPLGRLGAKIAPGAGLALGAMDAVNRAKKGDWGGAALSGLGAAASTALPPGLGTAAALGVAGLQAATDAAGLTGDKSKKGPSAKTAPTTPKAGMVDTAKGKRYKSSSDAKHYANYNDALAARNSRRGVTPSAKTTPAPAAPSAPAAPAKPAAATPAPAKPSAPAAPVKPPTGTVEKPKRQSIAQDVEDIKQMQQRSRQRQGVEMGGPEGPGKIDTKSVEADLKAAQERDKNKAPKTTTPQMVKASYEYDAFDIVLEYLIGNGHAETVTEAAYIMTEMDAETIGTIVEAKRKSYSAKKARKGEDIGLPGRGFEKISKEAGKRYGSKERGEKVAGAVLAGLRAKYNK